MKGFIIALVIIAVLCLGAAGIFIAVAGSLNTVFNVPMLFAWRAETVTIDQQATAPTASYQEISLSSVSDSITVVEWENDYPQATLKGTLTLRGESPELVVNHTEDTASFSVRYPVTGSRILRSDVKLTLYLPKGYDRGLVLSSVSGSIRLDEHKFTHLKTNTISGSIAVSGTTADKWTTSTVSGRVTAQQVVFPEVSLNSTSGAVIFDGSASDLFITTVSGRVEARLIDGISSGRVNTVSGRVEILLPKDRGALVEFSTTTGRFTSRGQVNLIEARRTYTRMEAGDNASASSLRVNTVSGGFTLAVE
ncbi:MAG: DUF4097 family beta strand repeat-containing protein [Clostridia bacterium]